MKYNKLALLVTLLFFINSCSDQESIIENIDTNVPPTASSVSISGAFIVGQTLTGTYAYSDNENDSEGTSIYQWYRSNSTGGNKIAITDATNRTYELTDADILQYISFEVTPAQFDQETGETVASRILGPVDKNSTTSTSEITLYQVENGELINPVNYNVRGELLVAQKDTAKHDEIWALVKKVVPTDYLSRIHEFEILWGATAESGELLGYVQPNSDLTVWKLGMAIDYAYPNGVFDADSETTFTVLHEFSHILTLNDTQVDETIIIGNCDNFYPDYPKTGFPRFGCSFDHSYINQFYNTFWKTNWEAAIKDTNTGVDFNFNTKYTDQFVTNYAGTTPSEDLAETYYHYVLNMTSEKTIAQQKIDYFKNFPEFEQIKTSTRTNLGLTEVARLRSRLSRSINNTHDTSIGGHHGCIRFQ